MNKNKDKKKFYCKNAVSTNKRLEELSESITGVLITTDKNKEKNCVRDAYNILNDALEQLYPEVLMQERVDKKTENFSEGLEEELKNLRKGNKFFYNFDTSCKGVVFIKVEKSIRNLIDINKIVKHIINTTKETKDQKSKTIARFLPIEFGIKAKFENFKKFAPAVLDKYFKTPPEGRKLSWKLEFKARNNNSIIRQEYLDFLLQNIDKNNFYINVKNPDYVLLLEITNDFLCFGVLENYYENKTYNLLTLSKSDEEINLERERLINKQRERENEKLNTNKETLIENKLPENEETNPNINNEVNENDLSDIEII